jgi:hypothetical protein
MLPKEGDTMDIADSQSKMGFPRYPQTVEVKKAMLMQARLKDARVE